MAGPIVCVFEDELSESFLPLTYSRPVFDLRTGIRTLFEKIAASYSGCIFRQLSRSYLLRVARAGDKPGLIGDAREGGYARVLFVNGRVLAGRDLSHDIPVEGEDELFVDGDILVAARLSPPRLTIATKWLAEQDSRSVIAALSNEVRVSHAPDVRQVRYPWDLIHQNGSELRRDFDDFDRRGYDGAVHAAATVYNPSDVYVAPRAEVMATAVLDARDGPIYIDEGARIEPFSFIRGPAYVGRATLIVSGRIREDTSIGPYCRIGGEVEACIFHGYSNKYHDGFTGHSYFGEWVNLGALTTTSDLKNTYGTVRVDIAGEQLDTGHTKLGSIVGDHVKLGIGVLINSGSTIGTGCNLFGGGMLPKVVPCFIWGGDGEFQEYDFDRMLQTAEIAMRRREVEQTQDHTDVLRYVFDLTAPLRRSGRI